MSATTTNAECGTPVRDCRLCAHYTTQAGGCVSVVQCVDAAQFLDTAPRQYWIAGPNVRTNRPSGAAQE